MARFNPLSLVGLTYQVAHELGEVKHGRVTVADSNVIVTDTQFRLEANDYWNRGSLWMLADGATAVADTFGVVSDFVQSTGKITLADSLGAIPQANDLYAIAGPAWSLFDYIAAVNVGIRDIGRVIVVRTGDITTAAAQTEYPLVEQADAADLPVVIAPDATLQRVRIQVITNDSNNNLWEEINIPWHVRKGDISAMPTLIFDWQPPVGYALELTFASQHPFLYQYGSRFYTELDDGVPPRLVVLRAALHLLRQARSDDFVHPRLNDLLEELQRVESQVESRHQPLKVARKPKLILIENYAPAVTGGWREELPNL